MGATMPKSMVIWISILIGLATFFDVVPVLGDHSPVGTQFSSGPHRENMRKMQAFKASLSRHDSVSLAPSPSPAPQPPEVRNCAQTRVLNLSLWLVEDLCLKFYTLLYNMIDTQGTGGARVYHVTSYGGDPTGKTDSTAALLGALSAALQGPSDGSLMEGLTNLGGVQVNLDGGNYLISQPLRLPSAGVGNLLVCFNQTIIFSHFVSFC